MLKVSKTTWITYSTHFPHGVTGRAYFSMGKPVVATPIEELKRFGEYVKIGATADEWERHIKSLLSRPWSGKHQVDSLWGKQKRLAEENSWERKVVAISKRVGATHVQYT